MSKTTGPVAASTAMLVGRRQAMAVLEHRLDRPQMVVEPALLYQKAECLESSKEFTVRDLLSAYAVGSNGGMISVHNFMATDDAFKSKVRPNEALMAKSFELVNQLKVRLFPQAATRDHDRQHGLA